MFDEAARRYARGESMEGLFGPRPERREGERREGPPGSEEMRQRWAQMSEEERQKAREEMMERMRNEMNQRVSEQASSGNAQDGGLRGEMFKRRGGGPGAGRGGRGGAGGGGGGPRGG